MKIGILGGTFDPPHIGHQILAAEAIEQLKLDHVLWVLTPNPPQKTGQNITPLKDRLKMVELAIEDNPQFILSSIDIDRKPPHYAVDTMQLLRDNNPNNHYSYLMGLDSLNDLPTWHKPVDFVSSCDQIIVMVREGEVLNISGLEEVIPGIAEKICILKTPLIDISGTDIRNRVATGKHYRYLVPEKINFYIYINRLYQS